MSERVVSDTELREVKVHFGRGEAKKHSVRMEALDATHGVSLSRLQDHYVPRAVMEALSAPDSAEIVVTYSYLPRS